MMEWLALIPAGILGLALLVIALYNMDNVPSAKNSDHQTCEQLRESGWAEKEIEEFMDNCNGWYFEPGEDL